MVKESKEATPIRVLLAKPGLDGHNRGIHVVARALADAGMEVIYIGLRKSPAQIVAATIEEGADVVGLSILSGAHLTIVEELQRELRAVDLAGLPVVVGGIIPDEDELALVDLGVAAVIGPGASLETVVAKVREAARGIESHRRYTS